MAAKDSIDLVRDWVQKIVIGLNFCPFAKHPFEKNQLAFTYCDVDNLEEILWSFWEGVEALDSKSPKEVSNTLLIIPHLDRDFGFFLEALDLCQQLLEDRGYSELFQLASFHPEYQFDGTKPADIQNYTNRAPHALIHILRVQEVEEAIQHHKNTLDIPVQNQWKLKELGIEKIKELWSPYL